MFRSFALAVGGVLALTGSAAADPINTHEQASFQLTNAPPPGTNTPGNVINFGTSTTGFSFTNNITTNTPPPPFGGTILTIGHTPLTTYSQLTGTTIPVTYNGQPLNAVFAIRGTVSPTSSPGSIVSNFQVVGLGIYAYNTATYNRFDPSTWGATNAAGTTLNQAVALFGAKPPEQIGPGGQGDPANSFQPASSVNASSLNNLGVGQSQGNFLVRELTGGIAGVNWLTITTGQLPSPNFVTAEGLHLSSNQELALATAANTAFVDQTTDAGFLALNTIAASLGGFANLAGAGTAFATGFGAPGDADPFHFAPGTAFSGPGGGLNSADVMTNISLTGYPILEQDVAGGGGRVPEPATLVVFAGMMGVGGLVYRRRRAA